MTEKSKPKLPPKLQFFVKLADVIYKDNEVDEFLREYVSPDFYETFYENVRFIKELEIKLRRFSTS